jgi:hypothetical protein
MVTTALKRSIDWFNRQNTVILIFVLSVANFFRLTLQGNEECYLAFAKQFMDHAWMPNSYILNQPPGGDLTFQVIAGFFLRFVSFEQLAAWGSVINFLLYAIPLALIFRRLKITNLEIAFLLQVIFFRHQFLYAGEWIFNGLEEKTLAYIFIFWSVYFLLKEKPIVSALFAAIATYFHFLLGGWMFAFSFIYFIFWKKNFRTTIYMGALYVLVTLPFIIYLYKTYFVNNPTMINGVNTNVIYTFWRVRHHIGLFFSLDYFVANHLRGVLKTLIMFELCVFVFRG